MQEAASKPTKWKWVRVLAHGRSSKSFKLDLTEAGVGKVGAAAAGETVLEGRTIQHYLSLPVSQYNLLDESLISRVSEDGDGSGDVFVFKLPLSQVNAQMSDLPGA